MDRRVRVLAGATVVQGDPPQGVVDRLLDRLGRPGLEESRRLELTLRGEHDLAETVEVEELRYVEGLRDVDRHPLEGLVVVHGRHREGENGRCHRVPAGEDADRRHRRQLGETVELVDGAGDLDQVTDRDLDPEASVEHEYPLRCQGIGVRVGVLLLEVEPP